MGQITTGLRAILSLPIVYRLFQSIMGAHSFRVSFAREFIRAEQDAAVLDVGCGPADILDYLPPVRYFGYDISEAYIKQAQDRFGQRGVFRCKLFGDEDIAILPRFDVVLAIGLLHHLDDGAAKELCGLGYRALKPNGRMITCDPCLEPGQHPLARFLILRDRGQNVRTRSGYAALAQDVFNEANTVVRHKAWIPYTHCIMECIKR